jgi:hypothetical protein
VNLEVQGGKNYNPETLSTQPRRAPRRAFEKERLMGALSALANKHVNDGEGLLDGLRGIKTGGRSEKANQEC